MNLLSKFHLPTSKQFGNEGLLKIYRVMKIYSQTISESVNQLISDEGDCRTAPATPGLLIVVPVTIPKVTKTREGRPL